MSYTVLARRYRSDSFTQVVGQEPIARTLVSAIATGRLAHAYLFTGTRGVGKTSMARLLARAINAPDTMESCPKPPDTAAGDFPPKEVQDRMAAAIMRGQDMNVVEIDGASNNSVDRARDLISNAGLSPTGHARSKVYIIDEVHMLSAAAFNALLKTMEEPPAHVKFILCTTESHKVPDTIKSRCQRFDFRNIPTGQIAEHLKTVLTRENLEAHEQVLWKIAAIANGSMRDGLSLLDRLISTGIQPLTARVLDEMLGLPAADRVSELVDHLAAGDLGPSLRAASALLDSGIAQDQLLDVLIERFRELLLLGTCGPRTDLVALSDDARGPAIQQAEKFDPPGLVHMIALCENCQQNAKSSSSPRAVLDATIVRLALAEKMADVTALLQGGAPGPGGKKKEPDLGARGTDHPGTLRTAPQPPSAGIRTPAAPKSARSAPAGARAFSRDPKSGATRGQGSAPPGAPRTLSQKERQEVLHLPLVKKVHDLFDVTLIDARREEGA